MTLVIQGPDHSPTDLLDLYTLEYGMFTNFWTRFGESVIATSA